MRPRDLVEVLASRLSINTRAPVGQIGQYTLRIVTQSFTSGEEESNRSSTNVRVSSQVHDYVDHTDESTRNIL